MIRMAIVLATLLCGAVVSPAAVLTVLPPAGSVFTGTTVGFGYTLENDDPLLFYVPTTVSFSVSGGGVVTDLFDYPSVAPGQQVSQVYTGTQGLAALTVPGNAPAGTFALDYLITGDLYSADPFSDPNATLVSAAADLSGSIPFTQVYIPEPSTGLLLTGGAVLLGCVRRRLHQV